MSFFVFKQKTAYELRISDWSSDVCSSDLPATTSGRGFRLGDRTFGSAVHSRRRRRIGACCRIGGRKVTHRPPASNSRAGAASSQLRASRSSTWLQSVSARRSEEHTSELQSLMRISYAVFCLKKKNK